MHSHRHNPSYSRNSHHTGRLIGTFALAVMSMATLAHGQIKFTVLARYGDAAPATPPGVTYSPFDLGFGFPSINNDAACTFLGYLAGPGVTTSSDGVIYAGTAGALALVAREGDPAPGSLGNTYNFLTIPPILAGSGAVAFRATLSGPGIIPGVNDTGLWSGRAGSLALAARTGDFAPGTGSTYTDVGVPVLNSTGQLVYSATTSDGGGLWFGVPGSITQISGGGIAPPGFSMAYTGGFGSGTLLNSAGQLLGLGTIAGPGVGFANSFCMWGGSPGSLHLLARTAEPSPDLPAGVFWSGFDQPVLTDVGAIAFRGSIFGAGVTASNDRGIWRRFILGALSEVAREGSGVPGAPLGTTFSDLSGVDIFGESGFFGVPKMNNANQVAFRARIAGASVTLANDTGIWAHNDIGALVLVAREGDAAPGEARGTVFTGFNPLSPVINNKGQVAFMASVTGGHDGIWATDPYGVMHRVIRETVPFEISPGVFDSTFALRPITGRGVQDATPTSFNDEGELLVRTGDSFAVLYIADVNDQCKPVVADQPDDATAALGADVSFAVVTTGPGTHTYQWRRDGVPLGFSIDGRVTGATTASVTIHSITADDAGDYDCAVTNLCRSVTSAAAALTVGTPCPADFNGDGSTDPDDLADFITCFFSSPPCPSADFNGDGSTDPDDLADFITAFFGPPC